MFDGPPRLSDSRLADGLWLRNLLVGMHRLGFTVNNQAMQVTAGYGLMYPLDIYRPAASVGGEARTI